MTKKKKKYVPRWGTLKRALLALCAGATLLVASPYDALGQTSHDSGSTYAGVSVYLQDADKILADGVDGGTIDVTNVVNPGGSAAGALINIDSGDFSFNSISIVGEVDDNSIDNHSLLGLIYVYTDPFGGSITGGNVYVEATNGEVLGVWFRKATNGGNTNFQTIADGASITLGNITAKTEGVDGAYGFAAGGIDDATISLASVTAQAVDYAATAVEIQGDIANTTNTVNFGDLSATSTNGDARGLLVGKVGVNYYDITGAVTVGNVNVLSGTVDPVTGEITGGNNAWGIRAKDITSLTLAGDMEVLAGVSAYGIRADNATDISGTGKNITVEARDAWAIGVLLDGAVTGDVVLGDITATSHTGGETTSGYYGQTGGAYGFSAYSTGDNTGNVTLGKVKAYAEEGDMTDAIGVEFKGAVSGQLTIESLDVKAEQAKGIIVSPGPVGGRKDLGTDTTKAIIGTVDVTATNGRASGIEVESGDAYLILEGDINVSATGGDAYGIKALEQDPDQLQGTDGGNANIVLGKEVVNISATSTSGDAYGIHTSDNLNIDLDGNKLITDNVWAGNDFSVTGNGTATVDTITVAGAFNVGSGTDNTTVTVDTVAVGEFNINDGATVVLNDLTNSSSTGGNLAGTLVIAEEFNGDYDSNVYFDTNTGTISVTGGGIFTDITANIVDNQLRIFGTLRSSANMSDGFLAALSMHNRYAAWNNVRDRLISGGGYGSGYRGQAPCDPCGDACDPCDPVCGPVSGARSAWVNYTGRSDSYRSAFNAQDWKTSAEGVQAGTDLYRTNRTQFGVLFGYEGQRSYNAADRIKADDTSVGVYGTRVLRNGADVRGVFAYGWQDYDMTRDHFGTVHASSFKGHTSETTLELGKRYRIGAWSVRPAAAVDVFNNNLKAAQESNGVAYGKASLTQTFFRFGTDLRYAAKRFTLNSGVYYAYDVHGQKLSTQVSQGSYAPIALYGTKLGRELLTFNLGGEYQVSKNFLVFGGYDGQYAVDSANDAVQSIGYVGAGWKW